MPRANRKSPAAAAPPKRASRSTTRTDPEPQPEAPSTRPTRGSRSQSKSTEEGTPKKVARKASPSPAPASSRESRSRTPKSKGSKAKDIEVEQEDPQTEPPKSRQKSKGRGDASESRGRVTRAVVQEEVQQSPRAAKGRTSRSAVQEIEEKEDTSPKQRGRSAGRSKVATPKRETPKRTPRKQPEPTTDTSRSRSRSARKPPVIEQDDEEEEEEEEEEEMEEEPVQKKKETRGRKKSLPKATKKTPSKSKSPAQRKSRKSDTASPEMQDPQVVLTKIDSEEVAEEAEDSEKKPTPPSRRSRSRGKSSETTAGESSAPAASPSPRSRSSRKKVESVTPKRQSRTRGSVPTESVTEESKEETVDDTKEASKTEDMPVLSREDDSGEAGEIEMEQEEVKEDEESKDSVEKPKEKSDEPENQDEEMEDREMEQNKVPATSEPVEEKIDDVAKERQRTDQESKEIVEELSGGKLNEAETEDEKVMAQEEQEEEEPEEISEEEQEENIVEEEQQLPEQEAVEDISSEQEEKQQQLPEQDAIEDISSDQEEKQQQLPQQDAIEDISSEEPLEEKQDEIGHEEIEEQEENKEQVNEDLQEPDTAMETNDIEEVKSESVLDGSQNGSSQEIPSGLVSPSRKRKLDDSEILDEELSPKKARRSIEVEEMVNEVKENGGELPVVEPQQISEFLPSAPQGEAERMETEMPAEPLLEQAVPETVSVPDVVPEVVVTEPDGIQEPVIDTVEVEPKLTVGTQQEPDVSSSEQDIGKDYVVIDMQDVPASDSSEVLDSIPKVPEMAVSQEENTAAQAEPTQVSQPITEPVQETVQAENVVSAPEQIDNNFVNDPVDNQKYVEPVLPQQIVSDEDSNINTENDPILNREFIPNPEFESVELDLSKQFSIVSYNILAQCHLERNDYSFTEREYLELQYRHNRLMKELQYLNGDIVCMQEVEPDYYTNYLEPTMKSLGYEGLMKKRTEDYFAEGEATFYRTSRFTLVTANTYSLTELVEKDIAEAGLDDFTKASIQRYLNRPDVLVINQLRCNNTGNIITVGNIHVHWGRMEVPDVQCAQIASAIKQLVKTAGSDLNPHILCGDFNSKEASPAYQLTTEGYLGDQMLQTLQSLQNIDLENGSKAALVNHLWGAFQHTSSLKSAYFITMGCEPDITSYNKVMCATVDYQFYSDGCLDNIGVLETAAEDEVMKTGGIPNRLFPSDHVSLKAAFSFK